LDDRLRGRARRPAAWDAAEGARFSDRYVAARAEATTVLVQLSLGHPELAIRRSHRNHAQMRGIRASESGTVVPDSGQRTRPPVSEVTTTSGGVTLIRVRLS
jgi:hypothetical protein